MHKFIRTTVFLLLILAVFPLASYAAPSSQPMSNWRTEYYSNSSLSGQPTISRIEARIDHDWGANSPALDLPNDHFSARWTTTQRLEKGSYLFFLTVDDGARVWVDGRLVIDAWSIGRKESRQATIRINQTGDHVLQVAYFENTGNAGIKFEWLQLGGEDDIVGAWHGEYFNNRHLQGEPVLRRQDGGIRFNWDFGAPAAQVGRDNFSVRWTRSIYMPEGTYHFRIQHDDGMRIFIDGRVIYSSWFDQEVSYKVAVVPINAGFRTFVVEYYDHVGSAVAQVQFDEDPGDHADDDTGGAGIVIDNGNGSFHWSGPNRFTGSGGILGDFFYTNNSNSEATNTGRWDVAVGAGNYEVFAFIPGSHATTTSARYRIYHFGRFIDVRLNQSQFHNKYVSLGTYYFSGQDEEFVTLTNATGEATGTTQIAFDALKLVKR